MTAPSTAINSVITAVRRGSLTRAEMTTWIIASASGLAIPLECFHVPGKTWHFALFAVALPVSTHCVQAFNRRSESPMNIDLTARALRTLAAAMVLVLGYCAVFQEAHQFARMFAWFAVAALLVFKSSDPRDIAQAIQCEPEIASASSRLMKRSIDLSVGMILLVVLFPVFILIALLIQFDSPGGALFDQERIGAQGRPFRILKFRTMRIDAPAYARSPSDSRDPRITQAGRVLRRLGLDELPQLINVVRGEMSLVGPRPEMPFIVQSYTARERMRLNAVPGITGLWQISPARALPIHENLQYDLYYIAHRSFWMDFAIIVRTTSSVCRGIGAV